MSVTSYGFLAVSLGNPLMVVWLVVLVIPVMIHLWSRRRFEVHEFAAIQFLIRAVERHARRIAVDNWVLLIVRTAILALFVLALLDPLIQSKSTGSRDTQSGRSSLWLLVVDNSYSMAAEDDGRTRLEQSLGQAIELVDATSRNDAFQIITIGSPQRSVVRRPSYDKDDIRELVESIELTDGVASLSATVASIRQMLDDRTTRAQDFDERNVVFLTDFGANTWEKIRDEGVRESLREISRMATVYYQAIGAVPRANAAITSVSLRTQVTTVGQPLRFDVQVESYGTDSLSNADLRLRSGDNQWERSVELRPNQPAEESFELVFHTPGQKLLQFELTDSGIASDNKLSFVVNIEPTIRVLAIGSRKQRLRLLDSAIRPTETLQQRISLTMAGEYEWPRFELLDYQLILLDNLSKLDREFASQLVEFVNAGGALIIGLGDRVEVDNYNRELFERRRLLPGRLVDSAVVGDFRFDPLNYAHPIVDPFRGFPNAGLLSTPIWKYLSLEFEEQAEVKIALAYDTGDPALIEWQAGLGRVFLFSSQLTESSDVGEETSVSQWSALPIWPSYVPLLQQMVGILCRSEDERRNVTVGESLSGQVVDLQEDVVVVRLPTGEERRVDVTESELPWQFAETWHSGFYSVRQNANAEEWFAVRPDPLEGAMQFISTTQLPSFLNEFQPTKLDELPQANRAIDTRLYQWLLMALLVLLLFESWLSRRLGRPLSERSAT